MVSGRRKIVVLGGGPCGLTAAWELAEKGCEVAVVERESQVGGLCRTVEHRGFRFDLGGHRFISKDRTLIDRVKGLLGDELLVATRRSVIRWRGIDYRYPLSLEEILRKVPLRLGLSCLKDLMDLRIRKRLNEGTDLTLEDWLLGRFGPTLYRTFFEGYTRKLWGRSPRELSADWAGQRIPSLSLGEVFSRWLRLTKGFLRTYASSFYYPEKGIGQIFERMAEVIRARGGLLFLSSAVQEVEVSKGKAKAVHFNCEGREQDLECDLLISTIPLPDLVRSLRSRRTGLEESLEKLSFRGVRFLDLLLERDEVSENTWIYVPDEDLPMTRIQEPKRRSPFNAPPGRTSLILEIPCDPGEEAWEESEEALLHRGVKALSRLGIEVGGQVLGYVSTWAPHAYPIYRLDYRKHQERLIAALSCSENLLSCGRQGLFRYLFMDQAMQMGLLAARWAQGKASKEEVFGVGLEETLIEAQVQEA
ncbi:MAG: FAD-dependent oxidoreductase [Nitrospinae bacterium]|nr:FAD-dependent oxidoreductase [Nitrospinota bacterium]